MSKEIKSSGKEEAKKTDGKSQLVKPVKGKTPKEIVKKHINDKNDIITEEDFRDVIIGEKVPDDTAHTPVDIRNSKKRPKDEDKDPETMTPWDVISE